MTSGLLWGWAWWSCMAIVSTFNLSLLVRTLHRYHCQQHHRWTRRSVAAILFTLVGTYRSTFPRIDVPKICWFPTPINWIFYGRCAACCAEIAWTYQFCAVTKMVGLALNQNKRSTIVGYMVMAMAIIAEGCSWTNLITTNNIYAVYEQGLWSLLFLVLGVHLFLLVRTWNANTATVSLQTTATTIDTTATAEEEATDIFRYKCLVALLCGMGIEQGYEAIGLYLPRYNSDEMNHVVYNGTLQELFSCHIVSQNVSSWINDVGWMTGYFSVGVWSSIWMAIAPMPGLSEGLETVCLLAEQDVDVDT